MIPPKNSKLTVSVPVVNIIVLANDSNIIWQQLRFSRKQSPRLFTRGVMQKPPEGGDCLHDPTAWLSELYKEREYIKEVSQNLTIMLQSNAFEQTVS